MGPCGPPIRVQETQLPKERANKRSTFRGDEHAQKEKVGMVGVRKLDGLLGAVDRHTGAVVVGTRPSRIHPDGVPGKRI